ncbi:hypothetical protein LRR18_18455, partial [Mangrovimonas sp. AS39]|uniref:hypothetical protein n=1 Tax=Mangrovimonas futianensis TaxID=2895523 RepID=UPI001E39A709
MNKTVQVGDRFKVKATPHLRKWGVRVHRWDNSSSDNRAWPGEIGVVERTDYTAHNGEPMTCYHLVFERDRRLGM